MGYAPAELGRLEQIRGQDLLASALEQQATPAASAVPAVQFIAPGQQSQQGQP